MSKEKISFIISKKEKELSNLLLFLKRKIGNHNQLSHAILDLKLSIYVLKKQLKEMV